MTIVDALVFVGPSLFSDWVAAPVPASSGIDAQIVCGQRASDYLVSTANDRAATIATEELALRRVVGRIDPNHPGALAEVDRCRHELGVVGYYLSPQDEVFTVNATRVAPVINAIAETGLPLVVEAGTPWQSEAFQIAEVALRHPGLPIVMTNGGQMNISGIGQPEAFAALDMAANLFITTSGVYRHDFLESCVDRYGARRVLFASMSPSYDAGFELSRAREVGRDGAERSSVLGGSACEIFGVFDSSNSKGVGAT